MMDRRAFLGALGLLATPLAVEAQLAGKVYRIGILGARLRPDSDLQSLLEAFTQGLRSHGWIEGQNVTIERRFAEGPEQYPAVAAQLVALRPDVIVTGLGEPALLALKKATTRSRSSCLCRSIPLAPASPRAWRGPVAT